MLFFGTRRLTKQFRYSRNSTSKFITAPDDWLNIVFYLSQGQPKQWLQLGRKALDANDYKKAVMLLNMSLYLSESNTEKSILLQIYHGLSEAHFNLNEHGRSVDAGNEYFKLRPIKSEVIF